MTPALLAGIAALAVLDSFNPATLVAVTLILLGSRQRPVAETLGFVAGAFLSVFLIGAVVYAAAGTASAGIEGGLAWIRRGAFGLAAVVLLVSAVRALRPRYRTAIGLPSWFSPWTAIGLGGLMTAADLPNAFPYFIAIERLVDAQVSPVLGLFVLAGYATIYCLPCLVLLGVGLANRERVEPLLRRLRDRFGGEGLVPASPGRAALLALGAGILALIAATA